MTTLERVLGALGITAVLLGLLMYALPGTALLFGTRYGFVTILGLLLVVIAIFVGRSRLEVSISATQVPATIGTASAVPTAGDPFDDALDRTVLGGDAGERARSMIHNRLTEVAMTVLVRANDGAHEEATRQLSTGEWTDDTVASRFLRMEEPPPPTWLDDLRRLAGRETAFQRQARRTTEAIVAAAQEEEP